jgi:hypothetical protein
VTGIYCQKDPPAARILGGSICPEAIPDPLLGERRPENHTWIFEGAVMSAVCTVRL